MIGCYPGSFDPLTIGHLAVAEAALVHCALDRLDLVLSEDPLGKPAAEPGRRRSRPGSRAADPLILVDEDVVATGATAPVPPTL